MRTTVTWIALADRMPDNGQKVLVFAGRTVTAATYEVGWMGLPDRWCTCGGWGQDFEWDFDVKDITHWALLPEPPAEQVYRPPVPTMTIDGKRYREVPDTSWRSCLDCAFAAKPCWKYSPIETAATAQFGGNCAKRNVHYVEVA